MAKEQVTGRTKQAVPGIRERAEKFLRETRAELGKVVWPDRRTTVVYTAVVIVMVAVLAVVIWVLDLLFIKGIGFIIG